MILFEFNLGFMKKYLLYCIPIDELFRLIVSFYQLFQSAVLHIFDDGFVHKNTPE